MVEVLKPVSASIDTLDIAVSRANHASTGRDPGTLPPIERKANGINLRGFLILNSS